VPWKSGLIHHKIPLSLLDVIGIESVLRLKQWEQNDNVAIGGVHGQQETDPVSRALEPRLEDLVADVSDNALLAQCRDRGLLENLELVNEKVLNTGSILEIFPKELFDDVAAAWRRLEERERLIHPYFAFSRNPTISDSAMAIKRDSRDPQRTNACSLTQNWVVSV
jgi:hypothetical protein